MFAYAYMGISAFVCVPCIHTCMFVISEGSARLGGCRQHICGSVELAHSRSCGRHGGVGRGRESGWVLLVAHY